MLFLEVERDGQWVAVGTMQPGDRPGTLSDRSTGTRHVLHFTCSGASSTIRRLPLGLDYLADPSTRVIDPLTPQPGELLAQLRHGECYELRMQADGWRHVTRVRFRHQDDDVTDKSVP